MAATGLTDTRIQELCLAIDLLSNSDADARKRGIEEVIRKAASEGFMAAVNKATIRSRELAELQCSPAYIAQRIEEIIIEST